MTTFYRLAFGMQIILMVSIANGQNAPASFKSELSNSFEHARSPLPLNKINSIGSNTIQFESYAFNLMLMQANDVRVKWHLEIPKPLNFDDVYIAVKATMYGMDGYISTRDRRFSWSYSDGVMDGIYDHNYSPSTFRYKDEACARLAKIPSKINAKQAEAIARNYLKNLNLRVDRLRLKDSPEVNQYKFEESDGKIYPLPCFNVTWSSIDDPDSKPLTFDISGINRQVAAFFNITAHQRHYGMPTNIPPNYFEMLGFKPPTNEAQLNERQPLEPLNSSTNQESHNKGGHPH